MVQRGRAPDKGLWGFPGGKVEWGETVSEAVVRELCEETGVVALAEDFLGSLDVIKRENGIVAHHFYLVGIRCQFLSGVVKPGDDAADARWVPVSDVQNRKLTLSANVDTLLQRALMIDV